MADVKVQIYKNSILLINDDYILEIDGDIDILDLGIGEMVIGTTFIVR